MYWLKRAEPARVRETVGTAATNKREIRSALLREWQSEWDSVDEGRRPHELLPNIRERVKMAYLQPGPGMIHYLTGHGPYGKYLRRIEKRPDDKCGLCNTIETPEHVLFQCEGTRAHGAEEREKLSGHTVGDALRDADLCESLNKLANRISRIRKSEHQEVRRSRYYGANPHRTDPTV